MNYRISIIDHVGEKAGMDYYSSSLAKGFINQKHRCTIYSNFIGIESNKITYKVYYEGHTKKNTLVQLYRFITATIKSSYNSHKEQTDLIILHLFSANIITLILMLIPKIFSLKIAVISHDISSFVDNDNTLIQNLIYNTLSDHIIVHNQFSYDELVKNIKLNNPKKVNIIKHGGYLDHIGEKPDKATVRKNLGLEIYGKYILFFGQIKNVKGLDILLEAMNTLPTDIKLIIAGKPWKADFSKYDKLIEKYNLEKRIIKIIRFIEDEEREKLFFAADVNVLPYRIIYQSGVLLMAMSHGLPVIASNLPANKEIIDHGRNGLLFESNNSISLSDNIIKFFKNKSEQANMSANALNTIQDEYNWNEIAKKYIKLLKR